MYTYDAGGNITAVKTYAYTTGELGAQTGENSYSYGDDNWKDLLTGYDGQAISYDEIGNPLSYRDGMEFTWEGRRLQTASAGGKDVSFAYNSDGIRTGKTVDGVTTSYFLDGSTVVAQKTGNDVLWFLYDGDGTRVGVTYNGTAYYYTANAQGDVTGIVDKDCNTVVEYSYDAWGKLLGTTGSLADTVGKANPFLYRGYYYDAETGLYYLNSRYYDPQTERFLNADGEISAELSGKNLFSYCNNNPIIMYDSDGHRAIATDDNGSYAIMLGTGDTVVYDARTHQRSTILHKASYVAAATVAGSLTAANQKKVDLGKGWVARIDNKGTQDEHIHVYNKKGTVGWYSQNANGSPHDSGKNGPNSGPPSSIKKV